MDYYNRKLSEMQLGKLESDIAFVLLQSALFDEEGLTKQQLCEIEQKSFNTISKAFDNITTKNSSILRCEKSGNSKLYDIDLNELAKL